MGKPETIYDPLFSDQWHLKNIGQGGGVSGVDINVIPAWNVTTGCTAILVAILDQGVEMHEDFYYGQLVTGWDAQYQINDGTPKRSGSDDAHGQAVAGIIAANHNSLGVRGVAPEVKILPIRIQGATVSMQAAAIDTAWNRGADIINLSWGWGELGWIDAIAHALQRAMWLGRNGFGTVVVKSAGNTGNEVTFPGNLPGVLTVGAVSNHNQPLSYTPRSNWVDIIAPSGYRFDSNILDIITTDRHPPNGYKPSSRYFINFDGTSAAAPQASGVAALLLSINPNLTEFQVRNIIKQSATSYGQKIWAGYGRLNAYKALQAVYQISGPTLICSSTATFILNDLPDGTSVTWTHDPALLTYLSGQGTDSYTVQAASSFLNGSGWVKATITNSCGSIELNKTVWVGKPNTPFAISGFPYNGYVFGSDTGYEFRALTSPGMGLNYYNWVIGCGSIVHGHGTDDIIVRTCTAPDYVTMNFDVSIRVGNECGMSDWLWRTGYVVGGSGATYMVYPNPASSEITVSLNEKYAEANPEKAHELSINQVRIMDHMGKSLMIKNFSGQELSVRINISALPKGYYIVKINDRESHTILKD